MDAFTLTEAAAFLKIPPAILLDKARAGEIPGAKIGRQWVFLKIDLMALIRPHYQQPGKDTARPGTPLPGQNPDDATLAPTPDRFHAKKSSHTRPKASTISLDQPGRLRVAHVESLLGISHATLYAGMKKGRYPPPDGYDGKMPYWRTETMRRLLEG
jgi:predicted DNA-binding transcriptional regulator AlpA